MVDRAETCWGIEGHVIIDIYNQQNTIRDFFSGCKLS